MEIDNSGHGAAKCAASMYFMIRAALEICSPAENEALKAELDDAQDRINSFVAINSIPPVTKALFDEQMNESMAKSKAQASALTARELQKKCSEGEAANIVHIAKTWSPQKVKNDVDDLLSVPRPAVINPCM